ncbi:MULTISPECIES: radical SAM protein [unclassified Oceanispirochaeta]|uniref:radical SAM protein n=1 Tax=unclassified Oceanispirochaeta TaxID=2635722 RepID=UPI000E095DD2|nr:MULTISPECIES: radical SAM protein [unclassified Oceanispirochaeta]MBF9014171.1 radical SAM protein [Oceanispirochaeta sp. M2]NPD70661.1 radical SAM protein [Oceanispirochaeta sp. M1]RDG34423.1 radical SAM protein [Oceanispirochaeta sp. M1]
MDHMEYENCRLCGRECGVNRTEEIAYCGSSDKIKLAWAGLHFGEEPPIVGKGGSGTVFFSGCTLGCPFCQNYQISRQGMGREIDDEEFLVIARRLKGEGAENLNLVTPSHFIPSLSRVLPVLRKEGFPIVWNSSGQESAEALGAVFPHVDIFLPDLKTLSSDTAAEYYNFKKYPSIVEPAIREMVKQRPLSFDEKGVMKRGVLVRHLVLPGELDSTEEVLRWFSKNLKGRALLSIMSQYTPVVSPDYPDPSPSRYLSETEYDRVIDMLHRYDLEDGFIQEWITGSDWLPDFNRTNPFSSDLSRALWHWKDGFLGE